MDVDPRTDAIAPLQRNSIRLTFAAYPLTEGNEAVKSLAFVYLSLMKLIESSLRRSGGRLSHFAVQAIGN
jgi:hypothetical protein